MLEVGVVTLKAGLRTLAPRGLRAYRILGGQLRGRSIVTSLHDYPGAILGSTERPLLAWFRANVKQDETWLDVGANYGYTSLALGALVGRQGHVYAFEPLLTTASCLNRTRVLNGMNQITVVPFGLGNPGGFRMMSVPVDRGMANHGLGGGATEDAHFIGFDYWWTAVGKGPVHGVKIDVQGMELDVLEGMANTLRDQHPKLVVELHTGVDRKRLTEQLQNAGYRLPGIALDPIPAEKNAIYRDDHSYTFEPA